MIEVCTICEPVFGGRLATEISKLLSAGWVIVAGPTLSHKGEPAGMNGYAVGFAHTHWLIIFQRTTAAQSPKPRARKTP